MVVQSATSSSGGIIILLLLLVVFFPIFCFFMYQRSKVSLITIQYAGGEIGFDKKWFNKQELELFEKQLRIAKDKVIEEGDNAVASKLQEAVTNLAQPVMTQSSKADELIKLTDLLTKGAITPEEFDKMKKELI